MIVLDGAQQEAARRVAERVLETYHTVAKTRYEPERHAENVLNGFGAELAVATVLGGHWNEGDPSKADIDKDLEVRTSKYPDADMPLYDKDKKDRRFVFLIGAFPAYEPMGWLYGLRGMLPQWWHPEGSPAPYGKSYSLNMWTVPVEFLWPFEVLRA